MLLSTARILRKNAPPFRVAFNSWQRCLQQLASADSVSSTHTPLRIGPNDLDGYIPFNFDTDFSEFNITLIDESRQPSHTKTTFQTALDEYIKPSTLILPTGKRQYRVVNLHKTEKLRMNIKPYRPHTFDTNSSFKALVDGFTKMWLKLSEGHCAEVHIIGDFRTKSRTIFQQGMNNCPHFHPDVILKAMPSGTSIIAHPQTNFTEVCWLLAPPPETDRRKGPRSDVSPSPPFDELKVPDKVPVKQEIRNRKLELELDGEDKVIMSHSERKLWQGTNAKYKKWATDEYGRAAPLYFDQKKKTWNRSPQPTRKWVIGPQGKPIWLKYNAQTKQYVSTRRGDLDNTNIETPKLKPKK